MQGSAPINTIKQRGNCLRTGDITSSCDEIVVVMTEFGNASLGLNQEVQITQGFREINISHVYCTAKGLGTPVICIMSS